MGTRYYDFDSSFDQVTAPSGSSPVASSDFVTLGYAQANFAPFLPEVVFAIANNQSAANITGLIASNLYRITRLQYWVKRIATDTVMEAGEIIIFYDGTNFILTRNSAAETDITSGMEFSIDSSTGQVKYTSSNMSGSYDTVNSKFGYTIARQGVI